MELPIDMSHDGNPTFLGFSYMEGRLFAFKKYYRPCGGSVDLIRQLTEMQRSSMTFLEESASPLGARLYDCSYEVDSCGIARPRFVWSVPSVERGDFSRLEKWTKDFLAVIGASYAAPFVLDVAELMDECLRSAIQPLYLLGGVFDRQGGIQLVKADYDVEIQTRANPSARGHYDDHLSFGAFSALLQRCAASSQQAKSLDATKKLLECGFSFHLFGSHYDIDDHKVIKPYFRWNGARSEIPWSAIMQMAETNGKAPSLGSLVEIADRASAANWYFYGFYVSIDNQKAPILKLYFRPTAEPVGKKSSIA